MVEINATEQNKEKKRMKRNEESQRPLGQYQTHQYLYYRVLRGAERKKGHEKIFEEIIAENFPNMGKEIVTQVQEMQ